jgi:Flp pilus assembly protein TadB
VPLSEHEQRQLEQIEQALYAEHPRFAKAVRAADPQVHYKRRVVYAALGFCVGIGLLLAGVVVGHTFLVVSVIGFVVMLSCSMWLVSSYRRMNGMATGRVPSRDRRVGKDKRQRRAKRPGSGLSERLEERWRRRQEGSGS